MSTSSPAKGVRRFVFLAGRAFGCVAAILAAAGFFASLEAATLSELKKAAIESEKGERAYRKEYFKSAERHFRAALQITPKRLHALSGLGWTLYDSGRWSEAFPIFRDSHKRYPKDGSLRRGLAYLYYLYGQPEEAEALLGSLDKERWPELANIDDELASRKLRGLPLPKLPAEEAGNDIAKDVLSFLQPKRTGKNEDKVPETLGELLKTPPVKEPAKEERRASVSGREASAQKKARYPFSQKPSFQNMAQIPGGVILVAGQKEQKVRPFRLDKLEVTNALYAAFVRSAGYPRPPFWGRSRFSGAHLPVVGVTWNEARAYCQWAGKRLPTEVEWEFAAAGEKAKRAYPWGKKFIERNAVFGLRPDRGAPKAVGRRPSGANPQGVEDMSGNAWEWVEDPYRKEPGKSAPVVRGGTVYRTLRGGSWVNSRRAMLATSRTGDLPGKRRPVYGFRCAANSP